MTVATDSVLDRAAQMTWRTLVVVAGVIVAVLALAKLRVLVLPVIVALLLATVLVPPVRWAVRRGVPCALATWLFLLGSLGGLVFLVVSLAPSVVEEFGDLGPTLQQGLTTIETWLVEGPLDLSQEQIDRYRDQITEQARGSGSSIVSGVVAGAVLAGEVVAGLILTFVLLFFFVKDGENMCAFGLRQLRRDQQELARALGRRAWASGGGYVRGTAVVAFVDAAGIALGLLILGVPLVLPLALLTFFAAFFPLVGAVAAGAVAVLVALVTGGLSQALLVLGLVVLVQQVESNVLAPMVLGRAVALHPVVILLVLTGGAIIGGLIGAFLAVPVTAVVVAVSSELKAQGIFGPGAPRQSHGEPVAPEADPGGDGVPPAADEPTGAADVADKPAELEPVVAGELDPAPATADHGVAGPGERRAGPGGGGSGSGQR
ncbi:MAG TPA: AI-2E family transporter [Acidimicrobiales bacterium]|nr:AI-2E family transporter [Acidimicrobiales bacterium]